MKPSTGHGRVHVIGGGLAGLAAALELTARGRPLTLYEAGPALGGRCRSYFDRELGCRIDNGNHLLLSGNDAAMRYLDRLGTRGTLRGPATPAFPFVDLATGERWTVRPNRGRLPWWLLHPSRRVPGTRLRDYVALRRLPFAKPSETVAGALPDGMLFHRLIEPLAVAALNTPAAEGSARLFWSVVAQSLARGGAQCLPLFPREGLSESFIDPAVVRLREAGAEILAGSRVSALERQGDRVTGLRGPDGNRPVGAGESVILAVPAPVAATLVPGLPVPEAHESILNLHFCIDAEPGEAGFIGLVGGLAEWVFVKPGIVSVTISAANRLLERDAAEVAAIVWEEVCRALLIVAPMPLWRLIREKRATFAATPQQHSRRPSATKLLPTLVLAGDWTDTGLPATIEGAIRSGFAAAQKLCAA